MYPLPNSPVSRLSRRVISLLDMAISSKSHRDGGRGFTGQGERGAQGARRRIPLRRKHGAVVILEDLDDGRVAYVARWIPHDLLDHVGDRRVFRGARVD